jgi:hypothetical protein
MPMDSAFDDEVGLDTLGRTWESTRMNRAERQGRRGWQRPDIRVASAHCMPLLLAALIASLLASVSCRHSEEQAGAGGQSGDEGRKPGAPWLGTGGAAAVPPP